MRRMRMILGALLAVIAAVAGIPIWNKPASTSAGVTWVFALFALAVLAAADLMILLLTSFKVEQTADRKLILKSSNWLQWILRHTFGGENCAETSLCPTFWKMAVIILIGAFGGLIAITMVCVIIDFVAHGVPGYVKDMIYFVPFGAAFFGALVLVGDETKKIPGWLKADIALGVLLFSYGAIVYAVVANWNTRPIKKDELWTMALAIGGTVAVLGLGNTAFTYWKTLRNTAFGRMLLAAKQGLCPVFVLPVREPAPPAKQPS